MSSKTQSLLSYLGFLWLVAYFAGQNKRDAYSSYHLKQGLGLWVCAVAFNIAVFIVSMISSSLGLILSYAGVLFLIIMILGVINAMNGARKPLPIMGKIFENQFPFLDH